MKTINKILSVAFALVMASSCVYKPEFVTSDYVVLDASRYSFKEDLGVVRIPVTIHSDRTFSTAVTYSIKDRSSVPASQADYLKYAVEGEHYINPNKSGVINITNEAGVPCDSIEIQLIDSTGVLTGNKKIEITIEGVSEEGLFLGGTKTCTLSIVDVDGGLNMLAGTWIGSGKSSGKDIDSELILELCDPQSETIEDFEVDEEHPVNLKIASGTKYTDGMGNKWESQIDVYGFFNDETSEITIYGGQVFDAGNFGEAIGVLYISIDSEADLKAGTSNGYVISVGDSELAFRDKCYFALYEEGADGNLVLSDYTCGSIDSFSFTMQ